MENAVLVKDVASMELSGSISTYEYQSITDSDTIRVILLQSSQNLSDPLQSSVIHISLSKSVHDIIDGYVALSYVWGNALERGSFSIDGKILDITLSLEVALKHVRDDSRVLKIWADGICINQKDMFDRNHQVSKMGLIYSTARHQSSSYALPLLKMVHFLVTYYRMTLLC